LKHQGWILDLYPKAGRMIVWLKQRDGSCVRLVDEWKPRIRIGGEWDDLIDLQPFIPSCTLIEKFERAGDESRSKVLEVEVNNETEAQTLGRQILRHGGYSKFRIYDVDVPSTQMYLYHNDLFPLAFVEADASHGRVKWAVKDSRETIDYELPTLRSLRLEITTEKMYRVSSFEDELDLIKIRADDDTVIFDSGSELDKLHKLVEAFREIDPDLVMTEGGDSFIFPYLARRAQHHRILHEMVLGRENSPLRVYEVQGHSYF